MTCEKCKNGCATFNDSPCPCECHRREPINSQNAKSELKDGSSIHFREPPAPTPQEWEITVVDGVEGKSLYINNYRVKGNMPWGGGHLIAEFKVKTSDIPVLQDLHSRWTKEALEWVLKGYNELPYPEWLEAIQSRIKDLQL